MLADVDVNRPGSVHSKSASQAHFTLGCIQPGQVHDDMYIGSVRVGPASRRDAHGVKM